MNIDMKERTPGALQRTEGSGTSRSTTHVTPRTPVTGLIQIDLRGYDDQQIREAVRSLSWAPEGAQAVIVVERGQFPPYEAAAYLAANGRLQSLAIACDDPATIGRWVPIFRGEDILRAI